MVVGESAGDGASVEDVALSEGIGASAGDGELPAGDGLSPDGEGASAGVGLLPDGEGAPAGVGLPTGDGLSPVGVGLPSVAQTLSAVLEPALLSTSVVALHVVQLVHAFWLVAVENVPVVHVTHIRSEVLVPLEAIFWPATQFVQSVQ